MSPPRLSDEQWLRVRRMIEAGGGTVVLDWWSRRGVDLAIEKALAVPLEREASQEVIELTEAADRAAYELLIALEGLRKHPFPLMKLLGMPSTGHIPTLEAALDEELQRLRKPLRRIRDFAEPDEDRRRLRTKAPGTRGRDIDPQIDMLARTLMGQLRRRSSMPLTDASGKTSTFVVSILTDVLRIAGCGYSANPRQTAQRTAHRLLKSGRQWPDPETPPADWFDSVPSDGSKSPLLN